MKKDILSKLQNDLETDDYLTLCKVFAITELLDNDFNAASDSIAMATQKLDELLGCGCCGAGCCDDCTGCCCDCDTLDFSPDDIQPVPHFDENFMSEPINIDSSGNDPTVNTYRISSSGLDWH